MCSQHAKQVSAQEDIIKSLRGQIKSLRDQLREKDNELRIKEAPAERAAPPVISSGIPRPPSGPLRPRSSEIRAAAQAQSDESNSNARFLKVIYYYMFQPAFACTVHCRGLLQPGTPAKACTGMLWAAVTKYEMIS